MPIKSISILTLLITLIGNVFFASAQNAWIIYDTNNSDLPFNTVSCIAIDSAGNKWVGTDYGLAMFDDTNWTVYTTQNSSLPDNVIRSINVDRNGDIWVGTFSAGLVKFDGVDWTTHYYTQNSGLPDDFVRAIAFDSNNELWIGTTGGLAHFNGTTWTVWNPFNSDLETANIACIAIDDNDVKHIGTINGGLSLFDGSIVTYTNWNSNLPDNTILSSDFDISGFLWFATPAAGLAAHGGGNSWQWFHSINSTIPSNSLNGIVIAPNNDKYITSLDAGIIKLEGVDNFSWWNTMNSNLPENHLTSIAREDNGIIWVGTNTSGLVRFDEPLLDAISEREIEQLHIYPSVIKEHDLITVSSSVKDITIRVRNVSGQLIHQKYLSNFTNTINVSSIQQPGIYFLELDFKYATTILKLIKL